MKKRNLALGMAILAVFAMILMGCDDTVDSNVFTSLLSGTFAGKSFSVGAGGSRTIGTGSTIMVQGVLRDGSKVYELVGYYDKEDGSFSLSTGEDGRGFELYGKVGDAKAKIKNKITGGEWDVDIQNITFTPVEIAETAGVAATGLPEAFWGTWDWAKEFNNQVTEKFGVMQTFGWEDADGNSYVPGCLVLGPYNMNFWFDLEMLGKKMLQDLANDVQNGVTTQTQADDYYAEQMAVYELRSGMYTMLEVTPTVTGPSGSYDAILLYTHPDLVFDGGPEYVKLNFYKVGNELRITFYADEVGNVAFPSAPTVAQVKAFDKLYIDKEDWSAGTNFMMLVASKL